MFFQNINLLLHDIYLLLLEVIFPENLNCVLCKMPISKVNDYSMCRYCYDDLIILNDICHVCGKPIINVNLNEEVVVDGCDFCQSKTFVFDRNISIVEYNDKSKLLIFGLKYGLKTHYYKIMGKIMTDQIKTKYLDILKEYDYISFMPLNIKRQLDRGFNQAELLAEYISNELNICLLSCIERSKDTKKLYKLDARQRSRELKNAFKIKSDCYEKINGKNIIIVDDVFTTGSSMNECAKILKVNGANKILSLSFGTGKYIKNKD